MANPTAGPYHVSYGTTICDDGGFCLAETYPGDVIGQEEAEANAALLAAAPDLLAACEALCEASFAAMPDLVAVTKQARDAIKKARPS